MSKIAWYRRRWLKIVVVAVVATLVGVRLGVSIWGRSRLDAYVKQSEPAWAAERARMAALGNPLDPTAKASCVQAYSMAGVDLGASGRAIGMALMTSSQVPVPNDARAVVKAEGGAIADFLRASRCGSYVVNPGESWVPYTRFFPLFVAARVVVVDARMHAEAGDYAGAVERLVAVVKAGTDFGEGTLMAAVVGASMSIVALEDLGTLVSDGRLPAEERERLARALDLLGPRMLTFPHAVHRERIGLHAIAKAAHETGVAPPNARPSPDDPARFVAALMPVRAVFADALRKQDKFFLDIDDLIKNQHNQLIFVSDLQAAEPRAASRRLTGMDFTPYGLVQQGHALCVPQAWQKVLSAALAIERSGTVPSALPEPNDDPCRSGPFIYARIGEGRYLIESVGKDGVVSDDDPRIERAEPPPRAPSL